MKKKSFLLTLLCCTFLLVGLLHKPAKTKAAPAEEWKWLILDLCICPDTSPPLIGVWGKCRTNGTFWACTDDMPCGADLYTGCPPPA